MNKTIVKNKPNGYGSSSGGIMSPVGYDPLYNGVSLNVGKQQLKGTGIIAEIAGSMAGVAGGLAAAYTSGGNPYIIAGGSTLASSSVKSLAEMIGLGHKNMKGMGIIPQHFIEFVDRLISNKKTLSQIKSAISNFELSQDLKTKLTKAVSSLLKSMSGNGNMKMKSLRANKMLKGAGGVYFPNTSSYGLVKF